MKKIILLSSLGLALSFGVKAEESLSRRSGETREQCVDRLLLDGSKKVNEELIAKNCDTGDAPKSYPVRKPPAAREGQKLKHKYEPEMPGELQLSAREREIQICVMRKLETDKKSKLSELEAACAATPKARKSGPENQSIGTAVRGTEAN